MGKAVLPVALTLLKSMFMLPEECQMVSVVQDTWYELANFLIESPNLPDGVEGELLPRMTLHVSVEHHPDDPSFRKITVTPKLIER